MAVQGFTGTIVCPPPAPLLDELDPFSEKFSFSEVKAEAHRRTKEGLKLIEQAGGDIVVFPEDISGLRPLWRSLDNPDYFMRLAEYVPGPTTKAACRIARKSKSYIVLSLYEKDGYRIYNTTVLISPKGKIKIRYRKIHPAPGEDWIVWPGGSFAVYHSEIGAIGIACGEDYLVPETACTLARMGADIIIVPSKYPLSELVLTCRSYELGVITIMAQADDSFLIDQAGRILAQSGGRRNYFLSTDFESGAEMEEERDILDELLTGEQVKRKRNSAMRKPKAYKLLSKKSWPEADPKNPFTKSSRRTEAFKTLSAEWEEGSHQLPDWER